MDPDLLLHQHMYLHLKLSEKYGNIFTVHFGPRKAVVLAGYETIKEALLTHAEEFGGRAEIPIFQKITKGNGK